MSIDVDHEDHEVDTEEEDRRNGGGSNGDGGSSTPGPGTSTTFLNSLCNIADHRLYKIVKWCKSLPLFKDMCTDDQFLVRTSSTLLLLSVHVLSGYNTNLVG